MALDEKGFEELVARVNTVCPTGTVDLPPVLLQGCRGRFYVLVARLLVNATSGTELSFSAWTHSRARIIAQLRREADRIIELHEGDGQRARDIVEKLEEGDLQTIHDLVEARLAQKDELYRTERKRSQTVQLFGTPTPQRTRRAIRYR